VQLIKQVVGKPKDWAITVDPLTGRPLNPLEDAGTEGAIAQENNDLGYYGPAMSLVVKAPSRLHTRASGVVVAVPGGGDPGAGMVRGGDGRPRIEVAGFGDERADPNAWSAMCRALRHPMSVSNDPATLWRDALTVEENQHPGLIIATADHLALRNKWDHAAEFLKANLRQGVVVEPWVYQSLAIALRESGASTDEIERAEVSSVDLEPSDAQGYLRTARSLADDGHYVRAIAFCRQAAALNPALPAAYADALGYAELARDVPALQWAAGNLLRRDWPVNNADLHARANQKTEEMTRWLTAERRKAEVTRLNRTVAAAKRRDLVIRLAWQGNAGLDLKVQEPTGSMCWALQPQTIGGGTLVADAVESPNASSYVAAEGFSGEYKISVVPVWGRPLGNKAQLRIIRHQGTEDETEELVTIRLATDTQRPRTIKLENGRRTHAAYVPPPQPVQEPTTPKGNTSDRVLTKLRSLADPEVTGVHMSSGGVGRQSTSRRPSLTPRRSNDQPVYQNKVAGFVQNSIDLATTSVVTDDRRFVRISFQAGFSGVVGFNTIPVATFVNPLFPNNIRPAP
jgi:hypothetical protein